MIISPMPLPIRICCSIAKAIKECKSQRMKGLERIKNVGKSILAEILITY